MIFNKHEPGSLLSSRFRQANRALIWGKAFLFKDRLELHELRWTGVAQRSVAIVDIDHVKWWSTETKGVNLMIVLRDGDKISLSIGAPGLWKHQIHTLLNDPMTVASDLPQDKQKPAAA